MSRFIPLFTLLLVCACPSDNGDNTNNETNNQTTSSNNDQIRNVTIADCEIACFNRASACELSQGDAEFFCQNSVCYRLTSQMELTCISGVDCLMLTEAVEMNGSVCEIVKN